MKMEISVKDRCNYILHTIYQQLVAVFVLTIIWLLYISRDWTVLGTWHIFLCTIGFALFMAEAVVIFSPSNIFTLGLNRLLKGRIHAILMFLACACVTAGVSIKIKEKSDAGISTHFSSTHAKLGLSAWILTIITVFGGLIALYARYIRFVRPVVIKIIHTVFGIASYVIGCVSIGYGVDSYMGLSANSATCLETILGIYVVYSLLNPIRSIVSGVRNAS